MAQEVTESIKNIYFKAKENLKVLQQKITQTIDKRTKKLTFKTGDLVFLKGIYLGLAKLNKLYIRLYKIKRNIKDVSYEINILGKNKVFPVFYTSLLKRAPAGCIPATL